MGGPKNTTWHMGAILGFNRVRDERAPREGWYEVQFVEGGPRVPVAIWFDEETDQLKATEGNSPEDPWRLWRFCVPITEREYRSLMAAREENPDMAATHVPLDLTARAARPNRRGAA